MRLFCLAAVASIAVFADDHATVPAPTITGPIAWTQQPPNPAHGYPFNSTFLDLKSQGYVEEEYFIEGTANRYKAERDAISSIVDSGHPYKTRIVVRRPATLNASSGGAKKFNGTVIVEWTNVTGSRDLEMDWFQSADHFVRAGYVWIGVSAQRVGVNALKAWSPDRYGSLDVTEGGKITNDDLSYDIMVATAMAVRGKANKDILGGLKPQRVIATGHSQSAGRLGVYVNTIHPLNPTFDGIMLHGTASKVRDGLNIKVFKLESETDVRAGAHQEDTPWLRTWEVAGTSHVDSQSEIHFAEIARLNAGNPPGASTQGQCDKPPFSQVPFHYVFNSAFDHFVSWIKDGTPPPSAPAIEFTSGATPAIARDEMGNALGGIRLAEIAVPIAVNTGQNSGTNFCRLYGSHVDFDKARLATLYPNHKTYVSRVREITEANLKAGYLLKPDAEATIAAAEKSDIGSR